MTKLHEILAVEGSRRAAFNKILEETRHVFKDKATLFRGEIRSYEPNDDSEDSLAAGIVERLDITTTVKEKMMYLLQGAFTEYTDVVLSKETANQEATGDLYIGGASIAVNLPVSFLLNLEKNLASLRDVVNITPTNQPGITWKRDLHHALDDVFVSEHDEETFRTKKIIRPFELSPATPQHPAQVEKLTEDVVVGKFSKQRWSGMLTPSDKSAMLGRMDKLIEAVRTARMRANETEIVDRAIGDQLTEYILNI